MKLSLRAIGMMYILKRNKSLQEIQEYTTDTLSIIENVIKELENKHMIECVEGIYSIKKNNILEKNFQEQEERIYKMFYKTKRYAIIAWFLEEENYYTTDDTELRKIVTQLYDDTAVLQWFDEQYLYQAYELLSAEEGEYASEKDGAEQVCVGRMQRLFDYATRVRGY